jgi:hypothetical protein
LLGDGLKEFNFPSVAPDGKRLILMRFDESTRPHPHLVDLASGEATPLDVRAGLWVAPTWR